MERTYAVRGRWPFPLDMLRHDRARAASHADQVLIDRMSGECSDAEFGTHEVLTIWLTMESGERSLVRPGGRRLPNAARWRSFGWNVDGVPELEIGQSAAGQRASASPGRRMSGIGGATPAQAGRDAEIARLEQERARLREELPRCYDTGCLGGINARLAELSTKVGRLYLERDRELRPEVYFGEEGRGRHPLPPAAVSSQVPD